METDDFVDINSAAIFEELSLKREVNGLGTVRYFNSEGELHRNFGPAMVTSKGSYHWFSNGKHHRVDGPARLWADGHRAWYINGVKYLEEDYWKEVERLKNGN